MPKPATDAKPAKISSATSAGRCLCGAVAIEIGVPAVWAWHDHSAATRRAQGCAYATYVGCWKSKVRVLKGTKRIRRFESKETGYARSFCGACGTPLFYERPRAPKMVNIPRAIIDIRTGREPRYHVAFDETPEWAYRGEPLKPLKDYPGVMWARPTKKPKEPLEAF